MILNILSNMIKSSEEPNSRAQQRQNPNQQNRRSSDNTKHGNGNNRNRFDGKGNGNRNGDRRDDFRNRRDNNRRFPKQDFNHQEKSLTPRNKINGWIVIDKPKGMTSNDVLTKLKIMLSPEKIGHGGTLDPLATGVLPIAFGEATKTTSYIFESEKVYTFRLEWGTTTATDDAEGEVIKTDSKRPSSDEIKAVLPSFIGTIMQKPPAYSALKVDGRRAYEMARNGEEVDLSPRPVEIKELTLENDDDKESSFFKVVCGKGTYVRSLARDIADKLGACGHVSELRRLKCGIFSIENAILLENTEVLEHIATDSQNLLSLDTVLDDIPALALTREEAGALSIGNIIPVMPVIKRNKVTELPRDAVLRLTYNGKVVLLARINGPEFKVVRVLDQNLD